jgi:hypothetical protein
MAFLTDRVLATGVTSNDLIHIVITGDTSQNPAGSSYKATMGQVLDLINPTTITGGTYNQVTGTITFFDDTGGSFNVTGLVTGYTNTAVTAFTYNNANTFTVLENDGTSYSASINVVTGMTFNGFLQSTGSTASGLNSFAFGQSVTASGNYSFVHGRGATALGSWSHAEGRSTQAIGDQSHVEGNGSISVGNFSHAEGDGTDSYGIGSHTEGQGTSTYGDYSHAEGEDSVTSGSSSHAEGFTSLAIGNYSHSEGGNGILSGGTALGDGSHAEGVGTLSSGIGSHAEGRNTITYGDYSHVGGFNTITNGPYQNVVGLYNITASTSGAFIVGNGNSIKRSNLLFAGGNEVTITGNLNVEGELYSFTEIMSTSGLSTSAYTIVSGTTYWGIDYSGNTDLTIPSPIGVDGLKFIIKDESGNAGTYRIRLTPSSGLIDGNSYVDMNINYMSLTLVARNNNWWII